MGCFVSKDSGNSLVSGRRVDDLKEKLLPSHRVVVLELKGAHELKSIRAKLFRANGPFFEISIKPEQELTGDQTYRSSHRPPTTEPRWDPPEKFEFVVTDLTDVKIVIGAWNFNSTRSPDEIGMCILELKDITETKTEKKLKIYSSDTGDFVGLVDLNVYSMDARKAASIITQVVYEYQRWKPVQGWGSTPAPGHFMVTDPGRWSNDDQSSFGDSIDSVLKKVDAKFEILKPWGAVGNEHDVDGWTYATNFNYLDWWPEQGSGMFVRRRQWRREITIISDDYSTVSPLQKADYVPPVLPKLTTDDTEKLQHDDGSISSTVSIEDITPNNMRSSVADARYFSAPTRNADRNKPNAPEGEPPLLSHMVDSVSSPSDAGYLSAPSYVAGENKKSENNKISHQSDGARFVKVSGDVNSSNEIAAQGEGGEGDLYSTVSDEDASVSFNMRSSVADTKYFSAPTRNSGGSKPTINTSEISETETQVSSHMIKSLSSPSDARYLSAPSK